jgi:hypothetical protein
LGTNKHQWAVQSLLELIKLAAIETTSSSALIRVGPALVAWNHPGIVTSEF